MIYKETVFEVRTTGYRETNASSACDSLVQFAETLLVYFLKMKTIDQNLRK